MVTIHLPEGAEQVLREAWGDDLDRAALEGLVIEAYRTGKVSIGQVGTLLGLVSKYDTEQWLGRRGVRWNYSFEDLEEDRRTLDRVLGRKN